LNSCLFYIIKVCNTWKSDVDGVVNNVYFKDETLFSLSNVAAAVTNSLPRLTVPTNITISEDAGK
jgi:hypothetical protein